MPEEKKKVRKINRMSVENIEERLKAVESSMKGLGSKYASQLLSRKEYLLRQKSK